MTRAGQMLDTYPGGFGFDAKAHCRICAESCRRCARACRALLDAAS
jgi:hypothetical protein